MINQSNTVQSITRELVPGTVQVWSALLDGPVSCYYNMLSLDEINRANSFYFTQDRNRFILRRGILRILLGLYTGIEPEKIQFRSGKNNKPELADTNTKIKFNLSHSQEQAIYAFTFGRNIGIDIERIREVPEMEQIVRHYFSPGEKEVFYTLPEDKRRDAFFNGWTRKEAFIKATGDGLSFPLDMFEVSLLPDEPAMLINIEGDIELSTRWSISDLRPASGYAAAFAMEGQIRDICCREWAE